MTEETNQTSSAPVEPVNIFCLVKSKTFHPDTLSDDSDGRHTLKNIAFFCTCCAQWVHSHWCLQQLLPDQSGSLQS